MLAVGLPRRRAETVGQCPEKFVDHYEAALTQLINQKRGGKPIAAEAPPKGENVVDLMDALKRSIANNRGAEPAKGKRPRKPQRDKRNASANQRYARCQG